MKARCEVTIEIDEVDFGFITNILCRASFVFEQLGSSHDVCVKNRDRYREDAKMAKQARQMMCESRYGKKEGGEK